MWQYRKEFPKPEGLQAWFAFGNYCSFLEDCFSDIYGRSIKLLDLYRNNNRKKFRNYWVLYQVRNVCQWELPASITATPANWTTILCVQGKYLWAGWLQSWVCCPPCRLSCQPKGWCAVQVGRSCCVKGWELLSVVLPSESCSSGVQFHYRHLVTAKPVQSQPFPSFNCPFPLRSSKYAGP